MKAGILIQEIQVGWGGAAYQVRVWLLHAFVWAPGGPHQQARRRPRRLSCTWSLWVGNVDALLPEAANVSRQ